MLTEAISAFVVVFSPLGAMAAAVYLLLTNRIKKLEKENARLVGYVLTTCAERSEGLEALADIIVSSRQGGRLVRWVRRILDRYVFVKDVEERMREVTEVLAEGKEREARAYGRVARATGDEDARRKAEEARREAERLHRLADEIALDVIAGRR